MLTAEIEMILSDFCQTALCRASLSSGRFICFGVTDFMLSFIYSALYLLKTRSIYHLCQVHLIV